MSVQRSCRSHPSRIFMAVAAAGVLSVGACDDPFQVIEDVDFASSLNVDLSQMTRLPSGVYVQDTTVGTGDALAATDNLTLDHTGWLTDGREFSAGQFSSPVGGLVPGFQDGIIGMQPGGVRRMIIPPGLAYGDNPPSSSIVPKGAVLVFEVELISID